jgi:hypothetical protein
MGLPNSSISQCRRVDVWTWQNGKTLHTYLDLDEIENGAITEVPEPKPATLPNDWIGLVSSEVADSGTLVVWSTLDLMRWKQSTALLRNAELVIGRVYRYFINSGQATIRVAAYEEIGGKFDNKLDDFVRPNDPLFLMKDTIAPAPFDEEPAFELFGDLQSIEVGFNGQRHAVTIKTSICKTATRKLGGSSEIGQHARKNLGVAVVPPSVNWSSIVASKTPTIRASGGGALR